MVAHRCCLLITSDFTYQAFIDLLTLLPPRDLFFTYSLNETLKTGAWGLIN